jgi:putative transposase
MPRPPREEHEGAVHHVWARGNHKGVVFLDDRDRRFYLRLLERTVNQFKWLCLAYCLMDNHVHLLLETPRPNLGSGMQWFHGQYGRYFADKVGRPGHVFQKPFGSKRVKDEEQMWTTIRYVAQNPVDAKLCETPANWEWSSHRTVIDGDAPAWIARGRLLEYFDALGGPPAERYAALVGTS